MAAKKTPGRKGKEAVNMAGGLAAGFTSQDSLTPFERAAVVLKPPAAPMHFQQISFPVRPRSPAAYFDPSVFLPAFYSQLQLLQSSPQSQPSPQLALPQPGFFRRASWFAKYSRTI